MADSERGQLGSFLREVIDWDWSDFVYAEKDAQKYTSAQDKVLKLVRICSEAKLSAIKLAIARVDGQLKTPVRLEFPKIYYLYPHARTTDDNVIDEAATEPAAELPAGDLAEAESIKEEPAEPEQKDLVTMGLRDTVRAMADEPKILVPLILETKNGTEAIIEQFGDEIAEFPEGFHIPKVKSVIAANLHSLNSFDAINEIFDQIDGKLVETIQVLGGDDDGDIYITQFATVAPAGAIKNKDGVYQIEQSQATDQWRRKLEQK